MGWFNDQIRQRQENDNSIMDESMVTLASAVLDKWNKNRIEDQRLTTKTAIQSVMKYYHQKCPDIPDNLESIGEQMEYAMRPAGIMTRDVELDKNWQNKAIGPMIGRIKETGEIVALLPGLIFGYFYKDPSTGKHLRITRKNADRFETDAICFYKSMPMKKMNLGDFLNYMKHTIVVSDIVLMLIAAAGVQAFGMFETKVYSLVTGPILSSKNTSLLTSMAIVLLTCAFAKQLVSAMKSLLNSRITIKTSVAVESSVIMRILYLPVSFFRRYSTGDLTSRVDCVSSLSDTILNAVFNTGLSSLLSLLYVVQIFKFAPALVVPSIIVIVSTVLISTVSSLLQVKISSRKMELSAEERGLTTAAFNGIQKIRLSGSEKRVFGRWADVFAKKAKLEYNPRTFVKINSVITTAISLAGTAVLYFMAVKTGVTEGEY